MSTAETIETNDNPRALLVHGDCLEFLKKLDDNSIDAVVTDPPAGINFMGRKWDRMKADGMTELQAFQEFIKDVFTEVYRVLKPGGHAVVWALPRTSHHTAMGLERAGFDIRDNGTYLLHVFGTGFPKSLDVSKAIDSASGAQREVIGYDESRARPNRKYKSGAIGNIGGNQNISDRTDNGATLTAPATEAAKQWDGWGTALKPAVEFWILARKPLEGTVAENVLEYGTGALNIDECRVGFQSEDDKASAKPQGRATAKVGALAGSTQNDAARTEFQVNQSTLGRWPAHLILDEGAAALMDEQSGPSQSRKGKPRKSKAPGDGWGMTATGAEYDDAGGASRFFYVAKASTKDKDEGLDAFATKSPGEKTEREDGTVGISPYAGSRAPSKNSHPTVKPTSLMTWLCKLVCPPGGVVLDPFMGSGSTGKAALREGFQFVGCEREQEYMEIAKARIEHELGGPVDVLDLDA